MKKKTKTRDTRRLGARVADGLVNFATGLGTMQSKRSHGHWRFDGLVTNWLEYAAAYQSSWLAKNIINTIPADITREWREIKCDDADKIRIEEDRVGLVNAVRDCYRWARLYGGAAIVMITDQDLSRPLNLERLGKGSLKNLLVLDRYWLSGIGIQVLDVESPDFMMPTEYLIGNAKNTRVHPSHIVRLAGETLPPRLRYMNQGWGDSTLRVALEPIEDLLSAIGGVGESLQEFNVDVIKRQGMASDFSTDQDQAIQKRFETFQLMKSVVHLALLDDTEDFERKNVTYTGIDTLLEKQMQMIAGACHTPMTKLFGMSPGGLNATGDSDLRNYNDYLRSLQNDVLDPALRKLDEVLVRSATGGFPDDFNYEWKPLSTPSPMDLATANKTQADADMAYLDAGVITVSQVQRNLQAAEKYTFDEERIDELENIEKQLPLEQLYENPAEDGTETTGEAGAESARGGVPEKPAGNPEKDKQ